MKKRFDFLYLLPIGSAVAAAVAVFYLIVAGSSVTEVTVKVTKEFSSSGTLVANPEVTATVMKEAGKWDAGDSVVIRSKWPCKVLSCEWRGNWHSGMGEANSDANQLLEGHCYTLTLNRVGSGQATFDSETQEITKVPCSP